MATDTAQANKAQVQPMVINLGPQHPSTHGVLRVILELDGETVVSAQADIGYLHTGIEKTAEHLNWQQAITVTDRMDYLGPITNNLGYVLAVEKLLGVEVPPRAQWLRVMFAELNRIASHMIWVGTHAMDMGAMSVFFYCFRERERILDLFEMAAGTRMNPSYLRIGGVMRDIPAGFDKKVREFVGEFPEWLRHYHALLDANPLWLERLKGNNLITTQQCLDLGVTGPMLRATGMAYDVRKVFPYSSYDKFQFDIPVSTEGDSYARYEVRMRELDESLRIITQAIEGLPEGDVQVRDSKILPPPKGDILHDMEALIHHFKLMTEGIRVPAGEVFQSVEGPRGEIGFYIVSDGGNKPYRMRVRTPSFFNLQALETLVKGRLVADVVTAIGTIDIVLGDVDR